MTTPRSGGDPHNLAAEFVALNNRLLSAPDIDAALQRLVDLAVSVVPGCDWAAITEWPAAKSPRSVAVSAPWVAAADNLQSELGDGPCLTAAAGDEVVRIVDVAADKRWPAFATAVLRKTPIRAVMSLHLGERPHRTALNLYSGKAGAFDDAAVTVGALFAAHARVLILHASAADKAGGLERALTASRQIGAAIGIVMATYKVGENKAFDMLRASSQHLNRKLRDVATDVTETGVLPTPPAARGQESA
jgi:hypothetical protein